MTKPKPTIEASASGHTRRESSYLRPRTRGELVRELHAGTPCEVVASNESTTRMLIDGWLRPPPYAVRPSENEGWVVFERNDTKMTSDSVD